MLSRRHLFALGLGAGSLALLEACSPAGGGGGAFTDAAGRKVTLPSRVSKVFAAGPPASVMLYSLAPEKMVGWVRAPGPKDKPFLAAPYRDLPETGRLTGRGNTANIEAVIAAKPDLIIDIGGVDATYASLADRVQEQTGIPYILLDGAFAKTAAAYRLLGKALGMQAEAEVLAAYADQVMGLTIPDGPSPRVYAARGPEGLETGLDGSINVELLKVVGATNVATRGSGPQTPPGKAPEGKGAQGKGGGGGRGGGLAQVSLEQVIAWDPEVIITGDDRFFASVTSNPLWAGIKAVRDGRIYKSPTHPFGWFDAPPGINRLIGVRWLRSILYPGSETDLPGLTREFYKTFYHVDLTDAEIAGLLEGAAPAPT